MQKRKHESHENKARRHEALAHRLDKIMSILVRLRSPVKTTGDGPTLARCFTCGQVVTYANIQCGHYIPRHRESTRWNFDNMRPQCRRCNNYHEGEHWIFRKRLVEEIGEARVAAMEKTAELWGMTHQPDEFLEKMISHHGPTAREWLAQEKMKTGA